MLSRVALAAHASLLLATPLANPALGAPGQGHSVVSVLESRSSDLEVADRLWQMEASGGNWLAMLFDVFKESRRDVQENQKYWRLSLSVKSKNTSPVGHVRRSVIRVEGLLEEGPYRAVGQWWVPRGAARTCPTHCVVSWLFRQNGSDSSWAGREGS